MKPLSSLIAVVVASAFAGMPAPSVAQNKMEDLEVTMQVVDGARELAESMSGMRGPDAGAVVADDRDETAGDAGEIDSSAEEIAEDAEAGNVIDPPLGRDFEQDSYDDGDANLQRSDRNFDTEDDFREDEEIDQDEYDELEDESPIEE